MQYAGVVKYSKQASFFAKKLKLQRRLFQRPFCGTP